jgi:hypothetical protein
LRAYATAGLSRFAFVAVIIVIAAIVIAATATATATVTRLEVVEIAAGIVIRIIVRAALVELIVPGLAGGPRLRQLAALQRFGLSFCSNLGACPTRNVGVFALRVPAPARHRAVVEADLVAQPVQLLLGQLAPIAHSQIMERQRRKRDSLQLVDLVAERLDHAMDLAMLALVDRDAEPGVLALARQDLDLGRHRHGAIVERDAVPQRLDLFAAELGVHLDVIGLGDVVARGEQPRRQIAIVGQEQDAFGVEVEPTDRFDRHRQVRQVVHHRRAATVIGHRGDASLGLIEQDIEVVERHHRFAVDQHLVAVGVDLGPEHRHDGTVDLDATGDDQFFGLAARCDARGGKIPLQADRLGHDLLCGGFGMVGEAII